MHRSAQVTAPLLASVALASLTGCRQPEMQRCVDENNQVVDNKLCGLPEQQPLNSNNNLPAHHYHYYYGGFGSRALGSVVSGGSNSPAAGHSYSTGTSRGGFGSTFSGSHGSGGHGSGGE